MSSDDEITQKVLKMFPDFSPPSLLSEKDSSLFDLKFRSTGIFKLDYMLKPSSPDGGLPRGKIIEIFGKESSGKTTTCITMAAAQQRLKNRNRVLYLDYEHAMDLDYAIQLGLKPELTLFAQPNLAEEGLTYALESFKESETIGLIIIDSYPALYTKAMMEGRIDDANIGNRARLVTNFISSIVANSNKYSPTVIFVNQMRANIGGWGPSEMTPGPKAIKFYSSIRLEVKKTGNLKNGIEISIKSVKNKIGPPMKTCEVRLIFGEGFKQDNQEFIYREAIRRRIIGGSIKSPSFPEKKPTLLQLYKQIIEHDEKERIPEKERFIEEKKPNDQQKRIHQAEDEEY